MSAFTLRDAVEADAPALIEIYRPLVESSNVSFEEECPSIDAFAARIRKAAEGWAWLVAESEGIPIAYAYGSQHRERPAYRWSTETSAYVDARHRRQGVGRALYAALLSRLAERGYCNAYAGIALPNVASIALHRAVGFEAVGVFRSVGWKHGSWHDVSWWHRPLRATPSLAGD